MAKKKKEKLVLVFDEKNRRDFLTGFRKRKNERRKKAKDELKKKEEERIKQARAEKRQALRKQVEEAEQHLATVDGSDVESSNMAAAASVTHDFGKHTVTVSTITNEDMDPTMQHSTYDHKSTNEEVSLTRNKETVAEPRQDAKRKFRKKAQKRKIQGLSDKKKHKNRKINIPNKKKKS